MRESREPHLGSLQNPKLTALPTVLVCPLKESFSPSPLRVAVRHGQREIIPAGNLLRPIPWEALRPMGQLDEKTSREIPGTFLKMLPD